MGTTSLVAALSFGYPCPVNPLIPKILIQIALNPNGLVSIYRGASVQSASSVESAIQILP